MMKLVSLSAMLGLLIGVAPSLAADSDIVAQIKKASIEIATVQKKNGNNGALTAISNCYDRASKPTATLKEARICATQDWVVSQVSIAFFSQLGEAAKSDKSYKIAQGANDRIARLLLSKSGGDKSAHAEFVNQLKVHAMPAFLHARQ